MTPSAAPPVALLLGSPPAAAPQPTSPPAPPADPISAARRGHGLDRPAVREFLARAEAEHAAQRPGLARTAEAARRAADRAKVVAEQAEATARDAEAAVANLDAARNHVRSRAAGVFQAAPPARLTECRTALRDHYDDLRAANPLTDPAEARARGRRAMAVSAALSDLDGLAAAGTDGDALEAEILALVVGIDRAERTDPPPEPAMAAEVVLLYREIGDRRTRAVASGSQQRAAALEVALRDLIDLRPGDPAVIAKAKAVADRVRVPMPAAPVAMRPSEPYRVVSLQLDE